MTRPCCFESAPALLVYTRAHTSAEKWRNISKMEEIAERKWKRIAEDSQSECVCVLERVAAIAEQKSIPANWLAIK